MDMQLLRCVLCVMSHRVHPEVTLGALRVEIDGQLGPEAVPRDYIFLRSVGRCLTKVRDTDNVNIKVSIKCAGN